MCEFEERKTVIFPFTTMFHKISHTIGFDKAITITKNQQITRNETVFREKRLDKKIL